MSYQTFLLALGETRAEVVPSRGAIVTRLSVQRNEVLYMDHDTLGDRTKNVRGGVPVLFPFAGKLPDDRFVPPGAAALEPRGPAPGTTIKQHGFARNASWDVIEDREGLLAMRLRPDAAVRAVWPWDFVAEQRIRLLARGVQIELVVSNLGDTPMPVAPGWHPYFSCPEGQKREVGVSAPGFTLDAARLADDKEFDFGVPAPAGSSALLRLPWLGQVRLEFSTRMRHLQLWSLPGKPFICVEPFWGPPGAILGPERDEIAPGAAADYFMRVEHVG